MVGVGGGQSPPHSLSLVEAVVDLGIWGGGVGLGRGGVLDPNNTTPENRVGLFTYFLYGLYKSVTTERRANQLKLMNNGQWPYVSY
jgi:hypothetical protein